MKKTFALVLALSAFALPAVSHADPISDHALAMASPAVLAQAQLAAPMIQTAHAVLAQTSAPTAPAPAKSIFQGVWDWAGSSAGITTILGVILGGLGLLFGTDAVRKRRLAKGVYHAFHTVEDASSEWPENSALKKVSEGLKAADEYMVANGWRPLTREEQALAQLGFTQLNGEMKAAEKVQANAIAKVMASTAAPALQVTTSSGAPANTVVPQTPPAL